MVLFPKDKMGVPFPNVCSHYNTEICAVQKQYIIFVFAVQHSVIVPAQSVSYMIVNRERQKNLYYTHTLQKVCTVQKEMLIIIPTSNNAGETQCKTLVVNRALKYSSVDYIYNTWCSGGR